MLFSENPESIDSTLEDFRRHRNMAREAREYYNSCISRAKDAYLSRRQLHGKDHLKLLVVYAEDTEIPSHSDQEGALFFLSPARLSLACAVDEGAQESMMFLLPETRKLRKCGSGVASLLLEFFQRRNCTFDELIVFVDNTASQNKNQYFFSFLSMLAVRKMFGCSSVRARFLCVGHTKFSPDRWFGLVKRRLRNVEINTAFDIEDEILSLGNRFDARALGLPGHACVPVFSHCPFYGTAQFDTFNFDNFVSQNCHSLSGHSLWFDVRFRTNGSLMARGAPCSNKPESIGYFWEQFLFIKDLQKVSSLDLSSLGRCMEKEISRERKMYLYEKIRPFVGLRTKAYRRHPEFGDVCFRTFTCPSGEPDDIVTLEEEQKQLVLEANRPTINRSRVRKMQKTGLIQAILLRDSTREELELDRLTNSQLRDILLQHAPPPLKKQKK